MILLNIMIRITNNNDNISNHTNVHEKNASTNNPDRHKTNKHTHVHGKNSTSSDHNKGRDNSSNNTKNYYDE